MYNGICAAIHREMERLDEKYSNENVQLNIQDLDNIDKMTHTMKSLAGYEQMKGASEYGSYDGGSYARGRSRTTGRYMSRDGGSYGYDPYHGQPEMMDRRY